MFITIIIAILLIVALIARIASWTAQVEAEKRAGRVTSFVAFGLAVLATFASMLTIVPDGHVAVTRAFGQFGDSPLDPGVHVIMPWEGTIEQDTRIQSYSFTESTEDIGDPIRTQANGGGNLTLELTAQIAPSKEAADDLLREVGEDWFQIVAMPSVRSCGRDSTVSLDVEEAFTTGRGTVADNILVCMTGDLEPYGIQVFDVQLRDVDPGTAVKQAIDAKQQAEQELKRAEIALREAELEAQKEAVAAFGVSQAEQIVACGGVETTREGENGDPVTVIVPNDDCEDQFSVEYLQWLYINQLDDIQGLVITTPEFNGELFVDPAASAGESRLSVEG